jgi:hypothetical protein
MYAQKGDVVVLWGLTEVFECEALDVVDDFSGRSIFFAEDRMKPLPSQDFFCR